MAVAKAEPIQDTEAQARLRRVIDDIRRQLKSSDKSELAQTVEDMARIEVPVRKELRRLAMPLTVRAPRLTGQEPEPTPERQEQVRTIDHAAALLEMAREVRAEANVTLSMR